MERRRFANTSMEYFATRELKKYDNGRYCIGEPCEVPIEEIIENQYDISIEYHYLRKNMRTLGQMVFDGGHVPIYDTEKNQYTLIDVSPKTMLIDIRLVNLSRYRNKLRFTYAHELAHYLIHKEYFKNGTESPPLLYTGISIEDDWIEKQANMFCSYFLVPTGQMKKAYNRRLTSNDGGNIVKELADLFGVAKTTMEIRLMEHGLL